MMRLWWAHISPKIRHLVSLGTLLSLGLILVGNIPVFAQDGAATSQRFLTSEKELAVGAIVSFEIDNSSQVQLANSDSVDEIVGVAVEKPLVASVGAGQTVQVATSGLVNVITSDINGDIKSGDRVTASPINGVGMKATAGAQVVGTAQADFDANKAEEKEVTAKDGMKHRVRIGSVPLQVNVTYFVPPDENKSVVPPFLQQLADSIAGQEVSLARIVASGLILLLAFISVGTLLYASIRSSIISIGRNPLSEGAVHKSLFEVGGIAIGVLLVMLCAIYLILVV